MKQTETYKFNLIETSDDFGPEKLNENAQKLEDALVTHEAAVDSKLKSQKLEWQAADTALSQTITAVEKGARLFHLAGPYESSSSGTVTVDLSKVNMSQYRALLFFVWTATSSGGSIKVGNMSQSVRGDGGNVVWVYRLGQNTVISAEYMVYSSAGVSGSFGSQNWNTISSITLTNAYGDIYAIKA